MSPWRFAAHFALTMAACLAFIGAEVMVLLWVLAW